MSENTDFSRLDALFQATQERLDTRGALNKSAYDGGPLASDHFLLNKSWEYFKNRIKTIEAHYEEILKGRDEEKKIIHAEMVRLKEEMGELERKNQALAAYEEAVVESRTKDYIDFKKINEKLRLGWEVERIRLHELQLKLEDQIAREKDKQSEILKSNHQSQIRLREIIDDLKKQLLLAEEKGFGVAKENEKFLKEKDETIESRNRKIDLLGQEIERRAQSISNLNEELNIRDKKIDIMIEKCEELNKEIEQQKAHIKNLNIHNDMLQHDRAVIKENWKKEQASWRELWDRSRENWRRDRG